MRLENRFNVAAPVDEAWKVLLDAERVAQCMPGATLDSVDGDEFKGRVKVKVGPIVVTYQGTARFTELDEASHKAVIDASGKEARGSGTAKATVTTQLLDMEDHTEVTVLTDLNITGRPAQFGRGVIADVATKLTERFAENLFDELSPSDGSAAEASTDGATAETEAAPRAARPDDDAIDLLGVSASPVLKRLIPLFAVLGFVALVVLWRGRRRRRALPD
ncbi:MAG TPA: SRPBCC family protein [Acidimicrobiales bacterium]|nr:SRPBCC family protein [Acidimicrobiales bacterium]